MEGGSAPTPKKKSRAFRPVFGVFLSGLRGQTPQEKNGERFALFWGEKKVFGIRRHLVAWVFGASGPVEETNAT